MGGLDILLGRKSGWPLCSSFGGIPLAALGHVGHLCLPIGHARVSNPSSGQGIVSSFVVQRCAPGGFVQFPTLVLLRLFLEGVLRSLVHAVLFLCKASGVTRGRHCGFSSLGEGRVCMRLAK